MATMLSSCVSPDESLQLAELQFYICRVGMLRDANRNEATILEQESEHLGLVQEPGRH